VYIDIHVGLLDAALKRPCAPTVAKGGSDYAYIRKRFRPSEIDKVGSITLLAFVNVCGGNFFI